MKINERITTRFAETLELGERVLQTISHGNVHGFPTVNMDRQKAERWCTNAQNLLSRVFGEGSVHYRRFADLTVRSLSADNVPHAMGILAAAKDDYENGYLFDVRQLISAEVFDDFLEQAEHLLQNGYHQPAAVIAGAVLEDGLRKLCVKHGVELTSKPKLDGMNAELVKAGAYSTLQQKRITALADLRNKAAHGKWDKFTKEDVEDMLRSTRRFMEEHFA